MLSARRELFELSRKSEKASVTSMVNAALSIDASPFANYFYNGHYRLIGPYSQITKERSFFNLSERPNTYK